jgi:hypothetical protein
MVFPNDFLISLLNRISVIIRGKKVFSTQDEKEEFIELFRAEIKKKNGWELSDLLIELESCLAFFFACRQVPAWITEDRFETILASLSEQVDEHTRAAITKLRYDESFLTRKSSLVEQRRLLGVARLEQVATV